MDKIITILGIVLAVIVAFAAISVALISINSIASSINHTINMDSYLMSGLAKSIIKAITVAIIAMDSTKPMEIRVLVKSTFLASG